MSELLLSRLGPLAHVWLASNYDKKLTKQQFLNTNIVTTSTFLSNQSIQPSSADETMGDTITLRLSGQLLLGIVRIYSRKTKYLLDDVHETLHKLKNSFKIASGASLGAAGPSTVNLPASRTTLSNLSRVTLQDQITHHDLFYQEDLVLDDGLTDPSTLYAQLQATDNQQDDMDRSIEFPRRETPELDIDMDFDLDLDRSIEVGRDAQVALPNMDESLLDLDPKPASVSDTLAALDASEPLELVSEHVPLEEQSARTERRQLVGVTETGVLRTTKRRLIVDSNEDLERGLPNDVLRNIQTLQVNGRLTQQHLTLRLTHQEKLDLLHELAEPFPSKRRRVTNLNAQLHQRCLELYHDENALEADVTADSLAELLPGIDIDFDLSLPGFDNDQSSEQGDEPLGDAPVADSVPPSDASHITQVALDLREAFFVKPALTFAQLTLGISQNDLRTVSRRGATTKFFDLLVLASHDCISLEQDEPTNDNRIPPEIKIRPRDNLVSSFV